VLLLPAGLLFSQQVKAQQQSALFYKWEDYEAANKELLDAQVEALTTQRVEALASFGKTQKEGDFANITVKLTSAAVRMLPMNTGISFDRGGASAFGIWIQAAARKLVDDQKTSEQRIKVAMIQVQGFIYWLEVDDNLNLLPATVTITEKLIKTVHDAFCPLYPFC
jgi:hypothetical protein